MESSPVPFCYPIPRTLFRLRKKRLHKNTITLIFDSENPDYADITLADAIRCSSAAPIFFPAQQLSAYPAFTECSLIDGGLVANNPAAIAISYVASSRMCSEPDKNPFANLEVLSIGTGDTTPVRKYEDAKKMGLWQWLVSNSGIFDTFTDGHSDVNEVVLDQLISKNLRLQPPLDQTPIAIDDASEESIKKLQEIAREYYGDEKARISRFFSAVPQATSSNGTSKPHTVSNGKSAVSSLAPHPALNGINSTQEN